MSPGLATPDFLTIGHICHDVISEPPGWRVGGTVYYSASIAAKLGYSVGVVTAGGAEVEALRNLPNTTVVNLEAGQSTSFENVYQNSGRRRQILRRLAPIIPAELVPPEWVKTPVVHLAPVAGEVPPAMFRLFPKSLLGLTPQGYMRELRLAREVRYRPWSQAADVLPYCAAVIFSEEDVDAHGLDWLTHPGPLFVITRGQRGCELIYRGKHRHVPGFPMPEIDPTGAGDVFAAAFLLQLRELKEPLAAARFANGAASFAVGGRGTDALPTRAEVESRIQTRLGTPRRQRAT